MLSMFNDNFKDFTLKNVRQTSKLEDIKWAIEKLKGYKIECQSLNLVDEYDINSPEVQKVILQPVIQSLLNDSKGNVPKKSEIHGLGLQEAKKRYLRLDDNRSLM